MRFRAALDYLFATPVAYFGSMALLFGLSLLLGVLPAISNVQDYLQATRKLTTLNRRSAQPSETLTLRTASRLAVATQLQHLAKTHEVVLQRVEPEVLDLEAGYEGLFGYQVEAIGPYCEIVKLVYMLEHTLTLANAVTLHTRYLRRGTVGTTTPVTTFTLRAYETP